MEDKLRGIDKDYIMAKANELKNSKVENIYIHLLHREEEIEKLKSEVRNTQTNNTAVVCGSEADDK